MFIEYVKYIFKFRIFMSYNAYKNSVKWQETALVRIKEVMLDMKRRNQEHLNTITSKNLPVVQRKSNTWKTTFTYKHWFDKAGTIEQLSKSDDLYTEDNEEQFSREYIVNFRHNKLINALYH